MRLSNYTIRGGDSLWRIAKKAGVSVQDILKVNPHLAENPNLIFAGENINIPVMSDTTPITFKDFAGVTTPDNYVEVNPGQTMRQSLAYPQRPQTNVQRLKVVPIDENELAAQEAADLNAERSRIRKENAIPVIAAPRVVAVPQFATLKIK